MPYYTLSSNIDTRIRAAETEYELEREELNILNLREEIVVLQSRLQETLPPPCSPPSLAPPPPQVSLSSLLSSSPGASHLVDLTVNYSPSNPSFGVTLGEDRRAYIDWATDDTKLKKEDTSVALSNVLLTSHCAMTLPYFSQIYLYASAK